MANDRKALILQVWNDIFGQGRFDTIDTHFAPGFCWAPPPGISGDAEGFKQMVHMYRAASGDIHFEFLDQVEEGYKVANRVVITGIHNGAFAGVAATGKAIHVSGFNVMEFENGKITSELGIADEMGMMQQLGVLPAPG